MRPIGLALLLLCLMTSSSRSEEVGSIPPPESGTWATDTTHTLSPAALEEISRLGTEINDQRLGQLGVAVVSTTGGRNSRQYATELFNAWGIGRSGVDDGVLLFVALKDHKVEIILGRGLTQGDTRARSDALMSDGIVPAFKRGKPEQAILAGARGLHSLLLEVHAARGVSSPTPAAGPASVPVADPPPVIPAPEPMASAPPPPESSSLPWMMGAGTGAVLLGGLGLRAWRRRGARVCDACGGLRTDIALNERDAHLSDGERSEERVGSTHYLLMQCLACEGPVVKEARSATFNRHQECAACHFVTTLRTERVLREATYSSDGEKVSTIACAHCGLSDDTFIPIPMLVESSSSDSSSSDSSSSWSSSDSSSSSSDSSSSSSSDYGGGSSSGDGSSGSW